MSTHRILCVDDEKAALNALSRLFFDEEDYETLTAASGVEGLKIMEQTPAELVISDQRMPRMTGVEFLEQVREGWPDTVRIMLTGYADIGAAIDAINKGGVYRFIMKPWNNEDLKVTVRRALEYYDLVSENQRLLVLTQQQNAELRDLNEHLEERVQERTEELRRSEAKRRDIELELLQEHKLAAIGLLASGIAHNLRGPLTSILGFAELLRMKSPAPEELSLIVSGAEKMNAIIENMLYKAQQEQDTGRRPIDLNRLLQEELTFLEADLEFKHNVKKVYELADTLPSIEGVYSDFSQGLLNIIRNALDAMYDAEEKRLTVRTWWDGEVVGVEISDTGCGIRPEDLSRVFDPFFTTKPSVEEAKGNEPTGTGLGLSSTYHLLRKYGARIELDSEVGKGTTVRVTIPHCKQKKVRW